MVMVMKGQKIGGGGWQELIVSSSDFLARSGVFSYTLIFRLNHLISLYINSLTVSSFYPFFTHS